MIIKKNEINQQTPQEPTFQKSWTRPCVQKLMIKPDSNSLDQLVNPLQNNGLFHKFDQIKSGWVTGYDWILKKILYFFLWKTILSLQAVQSLMRCSIMWHFIRVFTVCKSTLLGDSSPQRVNGVSVRMMPFISPHSHIGLMRFGHSECKSI